MLSLVLPPQTWILTAVLQKGKVKLWLLHLKRASMPSKRLLHPLLKVHPSLSC
uniref:E3 ubiquitin protein ligase upl2, putative n=1 Tax=Arundo donax TaxID=35708 RepID=A0A0A9EXC0_ARUDO